MIVGWISNDVQKTNSINFLPNGQHSPTYVYDI